MKEFLKKYSLYLAWFIALVGMLGSLYFSEVLGFLPCSLCWYQRIALYPLVIILPVGILKKDTLVSLYAIPLAVVGALIAIYHNLLYFGVISENLLKCTTGVSCSVKYINYFGFLSIPLLSLLSFLGILVLLWGYYKLNK